MLFCQGSVFKTLFNLALLNAALLCVFFLFFLRVFLRMSEPQLVLMFGFSPNKAVRWKATPYDGRVFLNRGTYSLSNGNRTEMHVLKGFCLECRLKMAPPDFSFYFTFSQNSFIERQLSLYAVRPFVSSHITEALWKNSKKNKCYWGAGVKLCLRASEQLRTYDLCETLSYLERCI